MEAKGAYAPRNRLLMKRSAGGLNECEPHFVQRLKGATLSASLALGTMTDGFNVVTIWTNDEGSVVVGVIDLADARRAVVSASSGKRCLVERSNLRTTFCDESDVHWLLWCFADAESEFRLAVSAVAGPSMRFGNDANSQWRECCRKERLSRFVVTHRQANVVEDQGYLPSMCLRC